MKAGTQSPNLLRRLAHLDWGDRGQIEAPWVVSREMAPPSSGPMHLRSSSGHHLRSTSRFAPAIRSRTIARIRSISAVRRPCVVRAFRMRSNPSAVRGPVLAPPCILHFPQAIAGALQGMPVLVRAPHRGEA